MTSEEKTAKNKKRMLEALEQNLGVVTAAAKSAKINRKTHYEYLKSDPAYKAAVDAIDDICIDFGQAQLIKNIKAGKEVSLLFYMKKKGRDKGWGDEVNVKHDISENVKEVFEIGGKKIVFGNAKDE